MWPLWLAGAAAGYFYGVQPLADSQAVQKAKCGISGGIMLSMGADNQNYTTFLKSDAINAVRLQYKQVVGCFPQAQCTPDPFTANRILARHITEWKAKALAYKAKAYTYQRLHNGKGLEAPGIPNVEVNLAQAQEKEATWCATQLESLRQSLPIPKP